MNKKNNRGPALSPAKGFSIIELIISASVLSIISIVVFASYPQFRQKISIKRTAQEIALAVRQAQAYGLGVRRFRTGDFPGYGVHFDINNPKYFVVFADIDENKVADLVAGDGPNGCDLTSLVSECVEVFNIQTHDSIYELCIKDVCNLDPPTTIGSLNILYYRPVPHVYLNSGSNLQQYQDVEVIIKSPQGDAKKIQIWMSGQISIKDHTIDIPDP